MSKSSLRLPSYQEATASFAGQPGSTTFAIGLPLHRQLDETRVARIHAMLSQYVNPLLAQQGMSGLYKSTVLLLPFDTGVSLRRQQQPGEDKKQEDRAENSPASLKEPQVVGFPSDETVRVVFLEEEDQRCEFWRQPAVLDELASSLRARLEASGHRLEQQPRQNNEPETAQTKKSGKKSFWSAQAGFRKSKSSILAVDQKLGWRTPAEDQGARPLSRDELRVTVSWREISMRVENDLGLYESRTGSGICLEIQVGS